MSSFIRRMRIRRAALALSAVAVLGMPAGASARYMDTGTESNASPGLAVDLRTPDAVTPVTAPEPVAIPQDLRTPDAVTPIVAPEPVGGLVDLRTPDAVTPMTPASEPVAAPDPVTIAQPIDPGFDLVSAVIGAAVLALMGAAVWMGLIITRRAHGGVAA